MKRVTWQGGGAVERELVGTQGRHHSGAPPRVWVVRVSWSPSVYGGRWQTRVTSLLSLCCPSSRFHFCAASDASSVHSAIQLIHWDKKAITFGLSLSCTGAGELTCCGSSLLGSFPLGPDSHTLYFERYFHVSPAFLFSSLILIQLEHQPFY